MAEQMKKAGGSGMAQEPGKNAANPLSVIRRVLGYMLKYYKFPFLIVVLCILGTALALLQGTLTALRPAVVAMIANAGLTILIPTFFRSGLISFAQSNFQIRPVLLFVAAIVLLRRFKWDPVLVMVLCGVCEVAWQLVTGALV